MFKPPDIFDNTALEIVFEAISKCRLYSVNTLNIALPVMGRVIDIIVSHLSQPLLLQPQCRGSTWYGLDRA